MRKYCMLLIVVLAMALFTIAPGECSFSLPAMPGLTPLATHTGFSQLAPSEAGKTPIIFAPSTNLMTKGVGAGAHMQPRLGARSTAKGPTSSQINQMFNLLSNGVGKKGATLKNT